MAIMAMTTSNSIRVKPAVLFNAGNFLTFTMLRF
jgi:hypothetical protein